MIFAKPLTKSSNNMENEHLSTKVLSFVVDDNGVVNAALVNANGEFVDYMVFNYLLLNPEAHKTPEVFLKRYENDKKQLENFVAQHKPDHMVVGAENLKANKLRTTLRGLEDQKHNGVFVDFGDMTAPKIYAKMDISTNEFKNFNTSLKEAISLARLKQNPLHEILRLWSHKNEENGILYMNFHHLQSNISQQKLRRELEKVAMECTNMVGIDINKILAHPHLQAPLQFICGLGPRKAKHVLDSIFKNLKVLRMRSDLLHHKIVEKTVYVNMAGFIIVRHTDNMTGDDVYDRLDITRIHPENYHLAKKIAKDSFDDAKDNEDEDYIEKIMKHPQKLYELDLEDYAHYLSTKGKQNMKMVLDFIVEELTSSYNDVRISQGLESEELFYKLTKETPFTLRKGAIIDVIIVKVLEKHLVVRLQCGKEVFIFINDVYDDIGGGNRFIQKINPQDFQPGMVVKARVKDINFDVVQGKSNEREFKPNQFSLSLKPSLVNSHKHKVFIDALLNHDKILQKYLQISNDNMIF